MWNEIFSFCKKNHSYFFISFVSFFCGCAICSTINFSRTGRRNSELAELERKLLEANARIEITDRTLADCRSGLESLAEEFDGSNGELGNIIERLRRIKDKIGKMEETFFYYDRNFNSSNND